MPQWQPGADGAHQAEIEGHRFRVIRHPAAARAGSEAWVAEILEHGRWSRIGAVRRGDAEARAEAEEFAAHLRELGTLGRRERWFGEGSGTWTPWGRAQQAVRYAVGITRYSTAGHGGFKVSSGRLAAFPGHLRTVDGWYEEDVEWCKVALAAPGAFTARERRLAEETLRHHFPEAWEREFGRALREGESRARDERTFLARHANDLIAVCALRSETSLGMVEVTATLGGRRDRQAFEAARRFLVPAEEYERRGRFGFVIDPERHEELPAAAAPCP